MPQPPRVATSSDLSNISSIMDQVFAVARDHSGIPWVGQTEWDFPRPTDLTGLPWLAVTWPEFVEFSVGYGSVGDFMSRSMEIQFTWDIDVYCLAPYQPGNPLTYSTPLNSAARLVQAFTLYENLNGSCDESKVGKPKLFKIGKKKPNGEPGMDGDPLWFASCVKIRAIEQIETDYTPAP